MDSPTKTKAKGRARQLKGSVQELIRPKDIDLFR